MALNHSLAVTDDSSSSRKNSIIGDMARHNSPSLTHNRTQHGRYSTLEGFYCQAVMNKSTSVKSDIEDSFEHMPSNMPDYDIGVQPELFRDRLSKISSSVEIKKNLFWDHIKDTDHVKEHYDKLNAEEVSRAACQLELVVVHQQQDAANCKIEFEKALMFKNRPMERATLLHFVIWLAAESDFAKDFIDTVLESLTDPEDVRRPGSLPARDFMTYYEPIHMAAGLGLLSVVRRLADYACSRIKSGGTLLSRKEYVNCWAHSVPNGQVIGQGDNSHFCQPIHDATYGQHADVTLWLLKHGADSLSPNFKGITPLHFLALNGVHGEIETVAKFKIKQCVAAMVDNTANKAEALEAQADMTIFIEDATTATPLDVAVTMQSKFPKDCVGLLAPCLQNPAKLSYFWDIKTISAVTPKGALYLVKAIAEQGKRDSDTLRHFRLNAQVKYASDLIASIFYAAPEAACEMLDLLDVEPVVEDSAHHPLPTHHLMAGWFYNVPMHCAYQADHQNVLGLKYPIWRLPKSKSLMRDDEDDGACKWQSQLLTDVPYHARTKGIQTVEIKVNLMPNLLDIDIIMSLASLLDQHATVMEKRTILGVIFVLWENLVKYLWLVNLFFGFLDLVCLIILVFFVRLHWFARYAHLMETVALAGVMGGIVRSILEFLQVFWGVYWKSVEFMEDGIMAPMWSISSSWFLQNYVVPSSTTCLMCLFLVIHMVEHRLTSWHEKYIFCVCLLLVCLQFVSLFRFHTMGAAIYTIRRTATSSAANQVVFIFGLIFVAVTLILLVLSKGDDLLLVINAFRGWLFADGDGFNAMGMLKGWSSTSAVGLVAAFFFNVMALNIVIAVYGNEYDKACKTLKYDFLRGRANFCAQSILGSYVLPYDGEAVRQTLIWCSVFAMAISVYASLVYRSVIASGIAFGCAQRVFSAAIMQCDWFSPEGIDSKNTDRYLWMCHDLNWASWLDGDTKGADDSGGDGDEPKEFDPVDIITQQNKLQGGLAILDNKVDRILDALESQRSTQISAAARSSSRKTVF